MTPGARWQSAIELLEAMASGDAPADDVAQPFFRSRRYIGAKDRAAVSSLVWGVLRRRAQLDWWIDRAGQGLAADARRRVLAALVLAEGQPGDTLAGGFDGGKFRPAALSPDEAAFAGRLKTRTLHHPDQPAWVLGGYPEWLEPQVTARFGDQAVAEMAALLEEAPVDLRVNRLKGEAGPVLKALAAAGQSATPCRFAPDGLRLDGRAALAGLPAFKEGRFEFQDEGSQLAAILADARPGMRVVDLCAGAGGKTLALAAAMQNRGHLVACDVSAARLERATQRLRRAGAGIVQRIPLTDERDPWIKRHKAGFDRVLVDAPCSNTGTWRRNPDSRWRLTPEALANVVALQARLLDSACRLVKPGGRLVYATCSLLRDEDEAQIDAFLARRADFRRLDITQVWAETLGGEPPPVAGPDLLLTPMQHGTDGFFVAVLERQAVDAAAPLPV